MHLPHTKTVEVFQRFRDRGQVIGAHDYDDLERLVSLDQLVQSPFDQRSAAISMGISAMTIMQGWSSIKTDREIQVASHHDGPRLAIGLSAIGRKIKANV